MHAVIFASSTLSSMRAAYAEAQCADYIIAADGGALHCLALNLRPDLVVGDCDSLEAHTIADLEAAGALIVRHPVNKEHSDLELALLEALQRQATRVTIYGGLGGRWDMSLVNLLLPAHSDFKGLAIELVEGNQRIQLITPARPARIRAATGSSLSLIPVGGDALGVTTSGLQYPLHGETLYFGSSRGVSNVLLGEQAEIALTSGNLLVVTMVA